MSVANQHIAAYIEVTVRDSERILNSSLSLSYFISHSRPLVPTLEFFEVQIFYLHSYLNTYFQLSMAQWAVDHSHKYFFPQLNTLPWIQNTTTFPLNW